jgi:hypothetical protein
MNPLRRRLIERRRAAREGRRFGAFYLGIRAFRTGREGNPFAPGGEEARCWEAGWKYAESEKYESNPAPVCRFGPGGDFVKDWPSCAKATEGKPEKNP